MLARIASARNGERIASVTTDVKFLVVLAFIGFVCPTVNAMRCLPRDEHDVTTGVPVVQRWVFVGSAVLICRLRLTSFGGLTDRSATLMGASTYVLLDQNVVARG